MLESVVQVVKKLRLFNMMTSNEYALCINCSSDPVVYSTVRSGGNYMPISKCSLNLSLPFLLGIVLSKQL